MVLPAGVRWCGGMCRHTNMKRADKPDEAHRDLPSREQLRRPRGDTVIRFGRVPGLSDRRLAGRGPHKIPSVAAGGGRAADRDVTPGRACAMTRRKETARREPALRREQPAQWPGRARPVRRIRRPLRRRNADAADPGGRAGLSGGARRSGVPGGAGRVSEELCRPAQRAVVRRAADPRTSAAPRSTSSATS